jgi:FKBP-type peptidyl-prolyl cis-trans isomerase FkpA
MGYFNKEKKVSRYIRCIINIFLLCIFMSACSSDEYDIANIKLIPVKSGELFQYINSEGEIVINPQFKEASLFIDGLALVKTSNDDPKWGFISEKGDFVIPPIYIEATGFNGGLAWVVLEHETPSAINKKGEIQFTVNEADNIKSFENGLAAYSVGYIEGKEKWGFINTTGERIINPQFSDVSKFSEEKCAVRNEEGKWGYIDKNGLIVINYQFDQAGDFKSGKSVVSSGGKYGVIDKNGKFIINPQYREIQIDGNLFLINLDGKYGWLDKEGKIIINPQFSQANPFFKNKITSVRMGASYGYINKEGKIIINPQFDLAFPFIGKLALVTSGNKIGFINQEGMYTINPQYTGISDDFLSFIQYGYSKFHVVKNDKNQKTSDGINYTYIRSGKETPTIGDYVLYHFTAKSEQDSLFINSYDQDFPAYLQYDENAESLTGIDEIFINLRKGDSVVVQTTAEKMFGGFGVPPFLRNEEKISLRIGVVDVLNEDNFKAYSENMSKRQSEIQNSKADSQTQEDIKIIEKYLSKNRLSAKRTESGLFYIIEKEGSGPEVNAGDLVSVHYTGYVLDGTVFDTSRESVARQHHTYQEGRPGGYSPIEFPVGQGQVIQGWDEGLQLLRKGTVAKLIIPSSLAYGDRQASEVITANSILVFDVEIVDVER